MQHMGRASKLLLVSPAARDARPGLRSNYGALKRRPPEGLPPTQSPWSFNAHDGPQPTLASARSITPNPFRLYQIAGHWSSGTLFARYDVDGRGVRGSSRQVGRTTNCQTEPISRNVFGYFGLGGVCGMAASFARIAAASLALGSSSRYFSYAFRVAGRSFSFSYVSPSRR
jgi:hypothetical protein